MKQFLALAIWSIALLPAMAWGAPITVVSYSMVNGEIGTRGYFDETYNGTGSVNDAGVHLSGGTGQLTDGKVGANSWYANLGNGYANEWVGWTNIQPVIVFDLGTQQNVSTVRIHTNNFQEGGVAMWGAVEVAVSNDGIHFNNVMRYETTASQQADTSARFIEVPLNETARFVSTKFEDGKDAWIMLSEVEFVGSDQNVLGMPEPSNYFLMGSGLCLAYLLRRKLPTRA
jgi:hypothetical protein